MRQRSHRPKFSEKELELLYYVSHHTGVPVPEFIRRAALRTAATLVMEAKQHAEEEANSAAAAATDNT